MSGRKPSLGAPGKCCLIAQSIFINALKRKQTLEDQQLFSVRLCLTLLSLTTVPHTFCDRYCSWAFKCQWSKRLYLCSIVSGAPNDSFRPFFVKYLFGEAKIA